MPLSLMSAPAIAQDPTPPPTTTPAPKTPPSAPATPTGKALAQAKKDNRRIEIESLRSETATYYANPDGKTLRMEQYLEPIRVKNAGGGFTPIDTTLVEADGVIKPKAAKGDLTLSAGGNTEAIKSKSGGLAARIDAPRTLPKPMLNGSAATYSSVYGKSVDLVVTATATGFRQQIVIRERPAGPVTFRVPVDLPKGIAFGRNAKGKPTLKSDNGKHSLDIRPAALLDAVAADANADLGAVRIGRAQVSLDGSALVYSPDPAFLADPATTFPVTMAAVDDDWYECTLGTPCPPGDPMDTYINDVDLTDSWDMHYRDQMWVGKSYSSNIAKRWRAYIQFPLPQPSDPFWGSEIQNADLELWNYLSNDCGQFVGSGITARRVTSDWDHLDLQWNSQPSVTNVGADTEYGAYSPDCSGSMNYEHDLIHSVDTIVQDWADGETNYGFQLRAGDESELRNWRRYRTREQTSGYPAHGPRLTVDFEPKHPRAVLLLAPGESTPVTREELEAFAAQGRLRATEPSPEPVTAAEMEAAMVNSPDASTISTDDLQSPLLAPVDGTVARWSFAEGTGNVAADLSGNDHQATVNDNVIWTPGVTNSALSNVSVAGTGEKTSAGQRLEPARQAAAQRAVAKGKPVEVAETTTATSITYAQPDGKSFKTEIAAGPVRTRQGGVWRPIDPSLVEQSGTLKPKVIDSEVDMEVSTGGTGAFVKMTTNGRRYALTWPTTLPKPTVKDNVATYTDAAGKGADLVVTVLPTGFRHDVVLRERPAKSLELRIGVDTGSLTLTEGKGGRLLLTDTKAGTTGTDKSKDNKLVASAPQPVMWDASAGAHLAQGRLPRARHAKIATEVVTTGGRTELVLKPDHAFLSDPATRYPVRVDPTTTLPFNHDVEVSSTNDADWPADPTSPVMMAGTQTGNLKYRVHLRFDTAGLTGATVSDAKLSLLNIAAQGCGSTVGAGIQVRRLTSAWDENNLHWANKPTSTTEDAQTNRAGYDSACADPTALEWPVTAIAQDWAGGAANHGLVLQSPTETNVNNYRVFPASEETFEFNSPPTLTVTTTGPASAPTIGALAITPAQNSGGTTTVTSLTPQLAATVSDTIGGTLTGQFEIEHDPAATGQGTGQIWTATSPAVASGSPATVTVPAAKLTDGWKVRWRARAANTGAATTSAWSAWQTATMDVPNPTVGAFQVTPSQVVNGVTVTTSVTPTLRTMVNDPAAQPLRAEVELEHDPTATGQGTGQIWTGNTDNVASGTQAGITVPGGKLTDGWKVRWRVRAVNTATTVGSPWSDWQALTIDVPDPVSEPSVGALQVIPSQEVGGTTVTPTSTPALLVQVSDPAGKPLRAEAEIEHDPSAPIGQGSGQIWTGGADNVPAGTQASIAVPADKLADGWQVRWRARAVSSTATSIWSSWQSFTISVPQPGEEPLAQTAGPVIRTDQSFTVAAWVRWNDANGTYTILEQKGTHTAPFRLGNDPEKGLVFTLASSDTASALHEGVMSGVKPVPNEWFHLAAVYDQTASTVKLYLNGNTIGLPEAEEGDDVDVIGTVPISFPSWNSTGPLTLGTSMIGTLDEVWVYNRVLSDSEINELVDGSLIGEELPAGSQSTSRSAIRAVAKEPMKYDRITPEECWEEFEENNKNKAFWAKNRFSSCQTHIVKFVSDGADQGRFYLMLIASTFNGSEGQAAGQTSRDMYFDVYAREFTFSDYDFLEGEYTVGLSPARNQTACRHITHWGGNPQHNNTMKTGEELRTIAHPSDEDYEKIATWRFRAAPGDTNGTDLISNCNFSPWIKTEGTWSDPIKPEWSNGATPQDFKLRCDSAAYINKQFIGGCVAPVSPSIEWKLGSDYDIAYKHVWKACYDKADTYPKKPTKEIKGCYNYSTNSIPSPGDRLTRSTDKQAETTRGRAVSRCRSLWKEYGKATPIPQDCDEFPPATALERTSDRDKHRHLSVCAMDGRETGPNQRAGAYLTRFYSRERVLRAGADSWFNRFSSPQMPNIETMDQLCWKPADQNSRYAKPGMVP
ncbi:DNRLRE domain-containing protein [Streptosporangium sp. NPDC006930]|uniref:DNRLRE domain-containing protein n=1 Tax=Streptosporangium sp. NPDC006930 TaxID=3154783 RepID=UPI0034253DAC